jgi:hypothetical protein
MDPFSFFAAVSAIFSAAGAVESSKASRSNRRAQDAQRQQQNLRAAMERRQTIRQTRMAFAQAQQNAENQGVGTSSGAAGGQGSILTQGNANLRFLDGSQALANEAGRWLDKASKQSATASMYGSFANMSMAAMGQFEQPDWLKNLGKPAQPSAQIPQSTLGATVPKVPTLTMNRGGYGVF